MSEAYEEATEAMERALEALEGPGDADPECSKAYSLNVWKLLAPAERRAFLATIPTSPAGPERLALSKTVWT